MQTGIFFENTIYFSGTAQEDVGNINLIKVITLGIMLVHIVLHVHPMPVIQELELIEINSFIHGQISYKRVGFHYISYILRLKRGALEV